MLILLVLLLGLLLSGLWFAGIILCSALSKRLNRAWIARFAAALSALPPTLVILLVSGAFPGNVQSLPDGKSWLLLLSSFVFSLGVGAVFLRTNFIGFPMLAHALERLVSTGLRRYNANNKMKQQEDSHGQD